MDRNIFADGSEINKLVVALRKESVDRNRDRGPDTGIATVALRKESVDRNTLLGTPDTWTEPSLSARRAWIEILTRLARRR